MQRTAKIIDCNGNPGRLKLRRIREHQANRAGQWEGGVFVFHRREQPAQHHRPRHSPAFGPAVELRPEHISDSGFSLLRYPMADSRGRYPVLERQGAGL